MKEKEIEKKNHDFIDILIIISKYKKNVFFTTLIVSILAVIYSLLTPELWTSKVSILPYNEASPNIALDNSMLNFGASLLGMGVNQTSNQLVDVLLSRTFSDKIIDEFQLIDYFELKHDDQFFLQHQARRSLHKDVLKIELVDETGLINVYVTTKDKFFSTRIANRYSELLDEYNLYQRNTSGKLKKEFLSKRIKEVEATLDSLKLRISEFGKQHNLLSIDEQVSSVVKIYSEMVIKKIDIDLEDEITKNQYGIDNPARDIVKISQSYINDKIAEIEGIKADSLRYILNMDDIPDITIEYANLLMLSEIQTKIYEFLLPQYEQAKLQELKDLPTIDIIDKAVPAGIRTKPKRAQICIVAFFISLFFSSLLSYSYDVMKGNGQLEKCNTFLRSLHLKK